MIAKAYGASGYYLVDVKDYAQRDMQRYGALARVIDNDRRRRLGFDRSAPSRRVMRPTVRGGLRSLRAIPDQSVDYSWSHTVLQHVRLNLDKQSEHPAASFIPMASAHIGLICKTA